jgi:hypothetical protein
MSIEGARRKESGEVLLVEGEEKVLGVKMLYRGMLLILKMLKLGTLEETIRSIGKQR